MTKTAKILILLTSVSLILVIYLIISSKLIVLDKEESQIAYKKTNTVKEVVDLEVLTKEYKTQINKILSDLDEMIINYTSTSSTTFDLAGTSTAVQNNQDEIKPSMLKTRLMNLTVPEEFKDYHVKIVLAVSKFDEYSESKLDDDLSEGISLVKKIKKMNKELE